MTINESVVNNIKTNGFNKQPSISSKEFDLNNWK